MWAYRNDEQAAANPLGGYRAVTGADIAFANATGGTAAAVTGLSFPIKKGQVWSFQLRLLSVGVSGGGKLSVSGPASPNILTMTTKGLTSGITAYSTDTVTALDTLGAAYNTSAVTGYLEVDGVIGAAVDGTVSFNAANVTNSNSFVIKAGSSMIATRIA